MILVDDLAAGGTKNLRHTPRGLVTLNMPYLLLLKKRQNLKLSSAAIYRWCFKG